MTVGRVAFLLTLCVSDVMAVRSSSASEMCTEDDLLREEDAALEEHEIAASEKILAHAPVGGTMSGTMAPASLGSSIGSDFGGRGVHEDKSSRIRIGTITSKSLGSVGSMGDEDDRVPRSRGGPPRASVLASSVADRPRLGSMADDESRTPAISVAASSLSPSIRSPLVSMAPEEESRTPATRSVAASSFKRSLPTDSLRDRERALTGASRQGYNISAFENDALASMPKDTNGLIETQGLTPRTVRQSLKSIEKQNTFGRTRSELEWWEKKAGERPGYPYAAESLKPAQDPYPSSLFNPNLEGPGEPGDPRDQLHDIAWREDKIKRLVERNGNEIFLPVFTLEQQMSDQFEWGEGAASTYKVFPPKQYREKFKHWVSHRGRHPYYQPYDFRRSYFMGPSKRSIPDGTNPQRTKVTYKRNAVPWTGINMYEFYILAANGIIPWLEFPSLSGHNGADPHYGVPQSMDDDLTLRYFQSLTSDSELIGVAWRNTANFLVLPVSPVRMRGMWKEDVPYGETYDLAFAIDCTSSMEEWIEAVKGCVDETIREYMPADGRAVEGKGVRVALVAFRDVADSSLHLFVNPIKGKVKDEFKQINVGEPSREGFDTFTLGGGRTIHPHYYRAMSRETLANIRREYPRSMDFTRRAQDVLEVLYSLKAVGGADYPEDVVGALWKALNLNWMSLSRSLFLITDAPPHGSSIPNRAGIPGKPPGTEGRKKFYEWVEKGRVPQDKPNGIGELFDNSFHSLEDDYPFGDPSDISVGDIMSRIRASGIDLHVLTVGRHESLNQEWGSALSTKYETAAVEPIQTGKQLKNSEPFQEIKDPGSGTDEIIEWTEGREELLAHQCTLNKMVSSDAVNAIKGAIPGFAKQAKTSMKMELSATVTGLMAMSMANSMKVTRSIMVNSITGSVGPLKDAPDVKPMNNTQLRQLLVQAAESVRFLDDRSDEIAARRTETVKDILDRTRDTNTSDVIAARTSLAESIGSLSGSMGDSLTGSLRPGAHMKEIRATRLANSIVAESMRSLSGSMSGA